ncbi:ASCH domain-containing protein [Bhargavaea ullalensis]|uniref:ASCH domain-containing protein n=1 Tax=Bhargavaea ullalensis TaxID=1265685 RepID=A0ABV2G8G0_9BACL
MKRFSKEELPPKTCSVERLVTNPADVQNVIDGKKTATRRNGRYADPGEVMELDGGSFEVTDVYIQTLGEMTEEDARSEGYEGLEDYKNAIISFHPGMKWVPKMEVWVHEFRPVAE